jgi:UDP-arabinose 4-epimerase
LASILVTGGAGYVGSHAAKMLARAGFQPLVLDNFKRGHAQAVKWGPFVQGDLADDALIRRIIQEHDIKAVLHFAAYAYVDESVRRPREYYQNNARNSLRLLDIMVDSGVRHIVFSSTCATYGNPETVPIPEDHPQRPVNPYGETKLLVERALNWYGGAYGISWMALRYFNAAGADPDGDLGENHNPETHLVPRAIQAALGQLPELQIFGGDYPTPDGTAIRDYIHVTDLAEAHVLALQHLMGGGRSEALNLGTGKGYSVREVIRMVESVTGRKVPVQEVGRRAGDPPTLVAQSSRAAEVLGWSPRYSDLETIVKTARAWQELGRSFGGGDG